MSVVAYVPFSERLDAVCQRTGAFYTRSRLGPLGTPIVIALEKGGERVIGYGATNDEALDLAQRKALLLWGPPE